MTFKEQHSITSRLSAIQSELDEKLRELHLQLNIELETKAREENEETNQETAIRISTESGTVSISGESEFITDTDIIRDKQFSEETTEADAENPTPCPENNFISPAQRQAKKTGRG